MLSTFDLSRYNGVISDFIKDMGTKPHIGKEFMACRTFLVNAITDSGEWKTRVKYGSVGVEQALHHHQKCAQVVTKPPKRFWELEDGWGCMSVQHF